MNDVESGFKAEMALDFRSPTERLNSRYNSDTVTLNTEFDVFKAKPMLVHRQDWTGIDPVHYHLEAQE